MFRQISSVLLAISVFAPIGAHAAPGIPASFYGATDVGVGVEIDAMIDGVAVGTTKTTANGKYGYAPAVFIIPDSENSRTDKTITFVVGGVVMPQSAVFENGRVTHLDLVFPISVQTNPVTLSPVTSTATTTEASTITFVLKDFNMLMANWGKRGTANPADFNADGVVDLADFNILMIHWAV